MIGALAEVLAISETFMDFSHWYRDFVGYLGVGTFHGINDADGDGGDAKNA
jgi:hypothetical protein